MCFSFQSSSLLGLLSSAQYHQHLYTLDLHIQYLSDKAHAGSGDWLARRWSTCEKRKTQAAQALRKTGKDVAFLREQWDLQVAAQTKPMPRV